MVSVQGKPNEAKARHRKIVHELEFLKQCDVCLLMELVNAAWWFTISFQPGEENYIQRESSRKIELRVLILP